MLGNRYTKDRMALLFVDPYNDHSYGSNPLYPRQACFRGHQQPAHVVGEEALGIEFCLAKVIFKTGRILVHLADTNHANRKEE